MENFFTGTGQYVASAELMSAVNVAITLEKPLLIKGEPGTGKTLLAQAVADALGEKLLVWNVKSTTKAQDGLYVYDVVQRLYDSQFGTGGVDDIARYIKLGKLGEAFRSEERVVLLIDEIDKADLEFPNDLLWELDRMEFYIPETGETVRARAAAGSHYHLQRRKGAARRLFAPLRVPLYRVPGPGPDGADRSGPLRRSGAEPADPGPGGLLLGAGIAGYRKAAQHLRAGGLAAALAGRRRGTGADRPGDPFAGVLVKKDKDLRTLRKALG